MLEDGLRNRRALDGPLVVLGRQLLAVERRHERVERAITVVGRRGPPSRVGIPHRTPPTAPFDVAPEHLVDEVVCGLGLQCSFASHDLEDARSSEILPSGPPATMNA